MGVKTAQVGRRSRRIEAPAALIFEILANPQRHTEFDGSDMLRGAVFNRLIAGVGDNFTMRMSRLGCVYLMINCVVEFEPDRRICWEPAPGDVPTAGGDPSKVGVPAGYRSDTASLRTVKTPPSSPRSLTAARRRTSNPPTRGRAVDQREQLSA